MIAQAKLDALWTRVEAQRERAPAIYSKVDFQAIPERFANQPDDETDLSLNSPEARKALLADKERMEFIRAYSNMGDAAADAYASLMREYGFRELIDMLTQTCDHASKAWRMRRRNCGFSLSRWSVFRIGWI